jgi:hypothetical protein
MYSQHTHGFYINTFQFSYLMFIYTYINLHIITSLLSYKFMDSKKKPNNSRKKHYVPRAKVQPPQTNVQPSQSSSAGVVTQHTQPKMQTKSAGVEHSGSKIPICKQYLHSGVCKFGNACNYVHECTSSCTRPRCMLNHPPDRAPASRSLCKMFRRCGFCLFGSECHNSHDCPYDGACNLVTCHMNHTISKEETSEMRNVRLTNEINELRNIIREKYERKKPRFVHNKSTNLQTTRPNVMTSQPNPQPNSQTTQTNLQTTQQTPAVTAETAVTV